MTLPITIGTAVAVIKQAYQNAGLIPMEAAEPSSEQYANGMNRLNMMIQFWQTQGLKLWTNVDYPLGLTQGVNFYSFGLVGTVSVTRPLRVPFAYFTDSTGIRRPLEMISRQEWSTLSQVNQQGAPNSIFVDKQQTTLNVYVWLTPDAVTATGTLDLVLQSQIVYAAGLLDTLNFPVEWALALVWGLSEQLAIGQPPTIVQTCNMNATLYRTALENWDVEDASTFFTMDHRGAYSNYGFR